VSNRLQGRITDIEPVLVHVNQRGDWAFVQVHTDIGITGLGEASHSLNDALLLSVVDVFRQRLVGQSPFGINRIWHDLRRLDGGRVTHTALSAIEQALWDILGQRLGVPIHALLGGALRDRIRLYANVNRHIADRSAEGFARAARQAVREGFTAIKIAPFDEVSGSEHVHTGSKAAWHTGIERVEAVRAAIGEEIELAVDCHSRMTAAEAIQVGRALAHLDLLWYEEPVPHRSTDALARVTQAVPMPTASAESIFALEGFRPFLSGNVVDVIMPDVKHAGGLQETKQIGSAARMGHVQVAPHNPSGPVATIASAHVVSTLSNFLILEYAWGEVPWRAHLIDPAEPVEEGHLLLSNAPGLGHRLNPDVVAEHRTRQASRADSSKVVIDPLDTCRTAVPGKGEGD
jgi:galactonate dehydratase